MSSSKLHCGSNDGKAGRSRRPLTAAQRTLVHPLVDMREQAQPKPIVEHGGVLVARRIVDGAIHFFIGAGPSLCKDVKRAHLGAEDKSRGYGTCMACRAEASKLRAVVR